MAPNSSIKSQKMIANRWKTDQSNNTTEINNQECVEIETYLMKNIFEKQAIIDQKERFLE